jgi:hypothetical protein
MRFASLHVPAMDDLFDNEAPDSDVTSKDRKKKKKTDERSDPSYPPS